jgi:hypothetical protein
LDAFLSAVIPGQAPQVLYKLQYDQLAGSQSLQSDTSVFTFPAPFSSLSFDDSTLQAVHEAWKKIMGEAAVEADYMTFTDREGALDDDDVYE